MKITIPSITLAVLLATALPAFADVKLNCEGYGTSNTNTGGTDYRTMGYRKHPTLHTFTIEIRKNTIAFTEGCLDGTGVCGVDPLPITKVRESAYIASDGFTDYAEKLGRTINFRLSRHSLQFEFFKLEQGQGAFWINGQCYDGEPRI